MKKYKKYKLAICTPIKDELRLEEWLSYYLKMNIDLFILRDNNSKIPVEQYCKELNINNVEIIWDDVIDNAQYGRIDIIHEHILPLCNKHNIDYLISIDADEFLFLNKFKTLQEMMNYYQPFDELNINWLIFSDSPVEDSDSLLKSSNRSGKYLNNYTKSITKVSSIITGRNAHNLLIKENSIIKNVFNNVIPCLKNNCGFTMEYVDYNTAPIFIAHYIYINYVEKKLCRNDGNFRRIFKNNPYELKILISYHTEHKNDLIAYINALRFQKPENDSTLSLENKHILFKNSKENYKSFYTFYGHDFNNKLPNGEDYYTVNNKLIEYLYPSGGATDPTLWRGFEGEERTHYGGAFMPHLMKGGAHPLIFRLFVCLFVCRSICLFVCLFNSLSVGLSVG